MTTQLSINPPSPPRQSGGGTGGGGSGGTTVQALRRGFDLPPPGAPHLDNECVLDIRASVSTATLDAIAARHAMTLLETVDIRLTGRRLHRWRLDGGGSVADMIRAVSRSEPSVAGMQAQFVFSLSQTPPVQINGDQYPEKLNLPEAHRLGTGNRVFAALLIERNPSLKPADIRRILTGRTSGPRAPIRDSAPGWSTRCGPSPLPAPAVGNQDSEFARRWRLLSLPRRYGGSQPYLPANTVATAVPEDAPWV